jgi:carbamoyl-phosphate synthase large subunit
VIGESLGHVGNLDCDVFIGPNGISVLELNPRFGGGYPFSHLAGVNLPAVLLAWASNQSPSQEWLTLTPGRAASKCDRVFTIQPEKRLWSMRATQQQSAHTRTP